MLPILASYLPSPALADYVDAIWIHELDASHYVGNDVLRRLPTTSPGLCIHYGGEVSTGGKTLSGCMLAGLQSSYRDFTGSGEICTVVIRFTPWGAARFFREPMDIFSEGFVELEDLLGRGKTNELQERLNEHRGTPVAIVRLTEDFLISLLHQHGRYVPIREAARLLNRHGGVMPVRHLAQELSMGERRLERQFKQVIGTSPKRFTRIVRFQHAVRRLLCGSPASQVAFELNFADQAHLIREFRQMCGYSPRELVSRSPNPMAMHYLNAPRTSDFFNTAYL